MLLGLVKRPVCCHDTERGEVMVDVRAPLKALQQVLLNLLHTPASDAKLNVTCCCAGHMWLDKVH